MTLRDIMETMEYGPAPESAALAQQWLDARQRRFGHFIAGEFRSPSGDGFFETINPATAQPLAHIAQGSAADIDMAVQAARQALPAWSGLSGQARSRYLYALARQVQKHARLLAVLETLDNGKTIRETRDIDIPLVARHFYHHAGWAALLESTFPEHLPVGVCGQIIPWNFPLLMLAWKVAPALAAGNTVVLKPAEFTPLSALCFASLCQQIGLPPGVLNIVTGDGSSGAALVQHPQVDKLAFTGSTEVGKEIRRVSAGSGKQVTLELGGKSPFIIFEDADLDAAVEGVVDAIWFNQGQVCCAGSRLLLQESIAETVLAKLRARMESLRLGDPLDKAVDLGAIIAPVQLQKIQQLVEQGKAEGAQCWQPSWALPQEGYFYPPTLFSDVAPASALAQVEIFGPVLVSMRFRTPAEALELANNSRYGLAASLWTEDINLALHSAAGVKAGVVWVNSTNTFDAAAPFGGYRESGYGREGGEEGLLEYLKPAHVSAWRPDAATLATTATAATPSAEPAKAVEPAETVETAESAETVASTPAASPASPTIPAIDRTAKLYIGGKQARPDSGYSLPVYDAQGRHCADVPAGSRKDIRNAVEAAHKASAWTATTAHNRAQVLYYLAENLSVRHGEFAARLQQLTGASAAQADREVVLSLERLFYYAAYADKYPGSVPATPSRSVTMVLPEAWGVMGIVCPDNAPLLSMLSLLAPALAMGNRVLLVPSARYPLLATDIYQVLDTSDVPAGAVNIITGERDALAKVLAQHDDVAALWYFATAEGSAMVERESVGNLKQTWVNYGRLPDWFDTAQGQGRLYVRRATQCKTIWIPYGV